MTIHFDHVSKRYHLSRNRPRSFRELFVGRSAPSRPGPPLSSNLWALHDVTFQIGAGETVALIGANGAGKSTSLKLISRIMQPTAGRVTVRGRVAALLELGTGFHPDLSGRDNVFLSGALAGMGGQEIARKYDSIVDFAELEAFMDVPVKHYSSGMFARLAFAVSVHLEPDVLLVDEVLAVGDQQFQLKCLDRIADLRRQGITICLVTHAIETVRQLCSRAVWFEHGRLRADGSAEAVAREYLDVTIAQEAQRLLETPAVVAEGQRLGNRKVEIVGVKLMDANGQPAAIFRTGQPLTVEMRYQAEQPVANPVFGIGIHRNDGLHISGPNTAVNQAPVRMVMGDGTVTYSIPALPLLDGLYHLTVAAVNEDDTEVYDFHDRAYPFRVVNRKEDHQEVFGLITLRGVWSVNGVGQAARAGAPPKARG